MKKYVALLLIFCFAISAGCSAKNTGYEKYSVDYLGAFDTVIQFMGFAKSKEEFETMAKAGQARFDELNKLFDIYNDYEGVNNIKTINDNAGVKPVEVRQEIIDLIDFSIEWYKKTNGKCNIALGPVLSVWHYYREAGIESPETAKLPPMALLEGAKKNTDISKVKVDHEKKTVYLEEKNMSLDVGAVAKGYASRLVADELSAKGYTGFIISSGGNVVTVGKPLDGVRQKWGVGLQNPDASTGTADNVPIETVYLRDKSVVTSGDYQRYYTVGGKKYHHLIDPETLMPADYFQAVTIIADDSGVADFMSTTIFLTPYDEGLKLANNLGAGAIWIMNDGSIRASENAKSMMKSLGGAKSTE